MFTPRELNGFLCEVAHRFGIERVVMAGRIDGQDIAADSLGTMSRLFGKRPEREPFGLGCAGNFLVALLLHELATERRVDLEDEVAAHLPELLQGRRSAARGVRIKHLLSHTSGWRSPEFTHARCLGEQSWERIVALFADIEPLFEPGTVFSYSRFDSGVLGRLVRQITGESPLRLLHERFIAPLNLDGPAPLGSSERESGFWDDSGFGLRLPMHSLVAITSAALLRGAGGSTRSSVLDGPIVLPQYLNMQSSADELPRAFGSGAAIFADGSVGHGGGDREQCCGVRHCGVREATIAVGMGVVAPHVRDLIFRHLMSSLAPDAGACVSHNDSEPSSMSLDELEGSYVGGSPSVFNARVENGALNCRFGEAPPFAAIGRNEQGMLTILGRTRVPVAVHRAPGSGLPCINLGMYAFRGTPLRYAAS